MTPAEHVTVSRSARALRQIDDHDPVAPTDVPSAWIGKRIGKLVVVRIQKNGRRYSAIVKCDCGTVKKIAAKCVYARDTSSCGCDRYFATKSAPALRGACFS